jgi:hypothetical protein
MMDRLTVIGKTFQLPVVSKAIPELLPLLGIFLDTFSRRKILRRA